jgi:hypothetical protein
MLKRDSGTGPRSSDLVNAPVQKGMKDTRLLLTILTKGYPFASRANSVLGTLR